MFMCDLCFLSLRQQQSFFSSLKQEFDKLFNTQLSLSLFLSCSYADDNTPYVGKNNVRSVVNSLKNTSVKFLNGFLIIKWRPIPGKCHFITSETKDLVISIENNQIANNKCKKLPGIKIDCKLIFNAHIDKICKKTGQKVNALSRVMPLANITKQYTF